VFLAVFGEEKGLLGTQFYTRHPVYPLAKTIANINLEHLGRTDDEDGPQVGRVTATGFDYSDIPTLFGDAAKAVGVEFYKHEQKSDSFFGRSDNVAFAKVGIPAHTFCVAFEFGDYHGLGDHWEKLDYANMAKVSEALAAGVWLLADRETPPKWNETVSSTETYRKAAASAQ
jgi:Zn-dependent M28 family amino/carboxypeptidase